MSESISGLEAVVPLPVDETQLEAQIPKPVGYHILVAMPEVSDTFGESGLLKSNQTIHHDSIMSMIGVVLDMGEQAYADKDRFPTGPWCKVGDFVMFRMNTGTRFKVAGQEYRLFNDDSVEAVVEDPNGITRV
jgi:co-chaperonin GroES (HSP10)